MTTVKRRLHLNSLWVTGALVTASCLAAVADITLAAAVGAGIDVLVRGLPVGRWILLPLSIGAILVFGARAGSAAAERRRADVVGRVRHQMLRRLIARGAGSGHTDHHDRLIGDCNAASREGPVAARVAGAAVCTGGGLIGLALIEPLLVVAFLGGVLCRLAVLSNEGIQPYSERDRTTKAAMDSLTDAVAGRAAIAAAGTQAREVDRVLLAVRAAGTQWWRDHARDAVRDPVVAVLPQLVVLLTTIAALMHNRFSLGGAAAAVLFARLAARFPTSLAALRELSLAHVRARRIAEFFARPRPWPGAVAFPEGPGRLQFCGVGLRQGGVPVLAGVDLVVPAGALIAAVGPGAQCLAAVAGGVIVPDQGTVLLDGVALDQADPAELGRTVGYAFARPRLVGETIGDAIGFGPERPADLEISAAARDAGVDGYILRLPAGYRTSLASALMTAGTAQRIGLARALVHRPRLLVAEDASAGLDAVTWHRVVSLLTAHRPGLTRLVVAGRPECAARADAVVWLDDGRVRAVAPHAQLWGDPDYRALFPSPPAPARSAPTWTASILPQPARPALAAASLVADRAGI